MPGLEINLFGIPRILLDGAEFDTERRKAIALVAYLAMQGGALPREILASFFWPDYENNLNYLRRELHEINKKLGKGWLRTDRWTAGLDMSANIKIDVREFEALLERSSQSAIPEVDLEAAIEIYRGDFLAGFSLADTDPFENWQREQAAHFQRKAAGALERLVAIHEQQSAWEAALRHARAWLALDDLNELSHRALMRIHAGMGDRTAAVRQFEMCRAALEKEMGIAPQSETLELYQRISRDQDLPAAVFSQPTAQPLARPVRNAVNPFSEIIARAGSPAAAWDFRSLFDTVFSEPLSTEARRDYARLLQTARAMQAENPVYEKAYGQLRDLSILNGSRIDLLRTVDRRIRGLANGLGALILIGGVSGIGKTSLVMAFQERIRQQGMQLVVGRCFEQEDRSYAIWQSMARSLSAAGFETDRLAAPIGGGEEAQSSYQLRRALADWLEMCAAAGPLVILLDDLHWADVDSLEMLDFLTSQPGNSPILFVVTYRSEEAHLEHALYDFLPKLQRNRQVDHLHVTPLSRPDIENLVQAQHGRGTSELAAYLHERAQGHPLFTVELLSALMDQGMLEKDTAGRWLPPKDSTPVPLYLRQLIMQRIERLGPQAKQLLSIAAIAGETWSLSIIEPVTGLPEDALIAVLEDAVQTEILGLENEAAEIYTFSHGLIREVLYTEQPIRIRRRLHASLAEQFESQQPWNLFAAAHHFYEAAFWDKALQACLSAGEEAAQRFAIHSALQWYSRALAASEHIEVSLESDILFDVYERVGRAYLATAQGARTEAIYARLRELMQQRGDRQAEGYAMILQANLLMRNYDIDEGERIAYEALEISSQIGDERLQTNAHVSLGALLLMRGRLEDSSKQFSEAEKRPDLMEDSRQRIDLLRMRTYQTIWSGRYREAEAIARKALDLSRKASDPLTIGGSHQNLAFALIESGQYREAYDQLTSTLDAIERSGIHHHQKPRLLNLMGYLHFELGDPAAALIWDKKAVNEIKEHYFPSYEMRRYSLLNVATDYLHLGNLAEVEETIAQFNEIDRAEAFVRFRYYNRYLLLLCELNLAIKQFDLALDYAGEALEMAEANGVTKNIAKSRWFEGKAYSGKAQFSEAVDALKAGIGFADQIRHGSLPWKIRLSLAEALLAANKPAGEVIRAAHTMIDQTIEALAGSPLEERFLNSSWLTAIRNLEDL